MAGARRTTADAVKASGFTRHTTRSRSEDAPSRAAYNCSRRPHAPFQAAHNCSRRKHAPFHAAHDWSRREEGRFNATVDCSRSEVARDDAEVECLRSEVDRCNRQVDCSRSELARCYAEVECSRREVAPYHAEVDCPQPSSGSLAPGRETTPSGMGAISSHILRPRVDAPIVEEENFCAAQADFRHRASRFLTRWPKIRPSFGQANCWPPGREVNVHAQNRGRRRCCCCHAAVHCSASAGRLFYV
jgi:hypothetical protein